MLPQNMLYPALLPRMRTPRLPVGDWTDTPADLNGLIRFAERRNLVSAGLPSATKGRQTCSSTHAWSQCKKGLVRQCHARLPYPWETPSCCCTGGWVGSAMPGCSTLGRHPVATVQEAGWAVPCPAALPSGDTQLLLYRRLGGQCQCGWAQ